MATQVKIDIKNDLGVTLADFNKEAHLGTFVVPVWAQDLYKGKTDEEIFDDFAAAIYESFTPIIGESLAFVYTANHPYFLSDKIRGNVRLAMFQEISNWMLNVPMEVKNNVNFSAQAGFNFSLSIQPWLINYDEFNIKTRTYIQETGLVGVCIEDLEGIELWVKPTFASGEELKLVSIHQDKKYNGKDAELIQKGYVDEEIRTGILSSHKSLAGEFSVSDAAGAQAFLDNYALGLDATLNNGRLFNNGNATPGEVVYIVPTSGSSFKAEEVIVGAAKELIILSNENAVDLKLIDHDARITANTAALAGKADSTVADQVALNTPAIATNSQSIIDNDNDIAGLETRVKANEDSVVRIDGKDATQDGRIEALEQAGLIDDKVWEGSIAGAALVDLSAIVDQNGDTFDFSDGKVLEVVIEKVSAALEQGHDLTVGKTNATPYVIGQRTFNAKLDNTGHLSMVETGAGDLSDFNVVKVLEAKAIKASTVSYTKNESDAKYALATGLAAVKTTADTAQQTTDTRLTTTSKQVWGAINELKGTQTQDEGLLANLGSLKTTDGDDLSTTTEELVTAKTLTATHYTKSEVDAAIAREVAIALSTDMDVIFDDLSTGLYKIGK